MISPVAPISPPQVIEAPRIDQSAPPGGDFRSVLNSAIQTVQGAQNTANSAVSSYLSGENEELHSTILATQRADLEFEMFMQVRNKVVSAYQEIMKMQV